MTDSMKCPFCGTEFDIMKGISDSVLGCPKCKHIATIGVWEALIDGKRAQDTLKGIEIRVAAIRSCVQDGYTQLGERNRNIFIALELFKDLIKEITSITKGKDNDLGTVD